ncbi:coiled-coil domain-containing protein 167 [Salvelinus fontinalis]|uniref:coiled-coil domain-containing protein 167 n=1 Tax=Salvelinus fontinalis TaxID=8038 RepID=UPI002485207D|nr:coiled-coil domain-containing protein 167 [Salvelinus fontinalis]
MCTTFTFVHYRLPSTQLGVAFSEIRSSHRVAETTRIIILVPSAGRLLWCVFSHKMTKSKDKREKVSVASEIDRVEERRLRCHDSIERAEFRRRREELSDQDRQSLEDEMTIMNERMQKYDKELEVLRGENRRNMVLSVSLLAISALFYYAFIHY